MALTEKHARLGLPGYYSEYDDAVLAKLAEETGASRQYIGWAPGDDYMSGGGGAENKKFNSWEEFENGFGAGGDVDLNLIADFYFQHEADSVECEDCDGDGYSTEVHAWGEFHGGWENRLTQDEVDVLVAAGRLKPGSTPTNKIGYHPRLGHDSIDRSHLTETRAKRLGVPLLCHACKGKGRIPTEEENLQLLVWMLHPRKGCGRGIRVKNIKEEDLPKIKEWVRKSFEKHTDHFKFAMK
jgi:hypothetical protein